MVELKKVVLVQNVNNIDEKEPILETVEVESAQDAPAPSGAFATVVFTIIVATAIGVGGLMHLSPRSASVDHAHLQGQIQQIKGLYDPSTLPPKPMPNHRIYPEADLYASEEFRKEMAQQLNEQQQKLREIQAQSAAGQNQRSSDGPQMQK